MNWHDRDRAHGQGLPATALDYRKLAHTLWAFAPAEDGNGQVLLRRRDEPAPGIEPRVGTTVQVTVDVEPEPATAAPTTDEALLEGVMVPLPEVRLAQLNLHETDPGEWVEAKVAFAPLLYEGKVQVPAGRSFTVEGYHPGTADGDAFGDPEIRNRMLVSERGRPELTRIRLRDDQTGRIVSVLPFEFERYIAARGVYPKPPVQHKSRSAPALAAPEPRVSPRTDTVSMR